MATPLATASSSSSRSPAFSWWLVLLVGVGGFARGGEFNRKYANKIMRLRILAQFVAVMLIVLFVWLPKRGG